MYRLIKKAIPIVLASLAIITLCIKPLKAQNETVSGTGNSAASGLAGGVSGLPGSVSGVSAGVGAGSGGGDYLKIIANNTTLILADVNNLPKYIQAAAAFIIAWTYKDDSNDTANFQAAFATLSKAYTANDTTRDSVQANLINNFFKNTPPSDGNNQNDVSYLTLKNLLINNPETRTDSQGKPLDPGLTYVENAAGLLLPHTKPQSGWGGDVTAQKKYYYYYNSISAIQTYNAYVMSNLYADYKNNDAASQAQQQLIQQATSSDWISNIATEKIGIVLRQILMFESQSFVTLMRLLDTEKQVLSAQTMTNTLLILLNQQNEELLVGKAQGKIK